MAKNKQPAPAKKNVTATDYIQALLSAPKFSRQVTCHRILEARDAEYGAPRRPWSKAVANILGDMQLYRHQAEGTDFVRAGRDVVVATPTASGKTLIYNLPVLEKFITDRDTRALYIFPLKALAQDQRGALERLTALWPKDARPSVALYDGDTTDYARKKVRREPPNVLITNPEMLHLGILPYHASWTTFLASLEFVVLDEAHTYRGVTGSHMAQVLRRLERICARYNAKPVRILSTATVGNPVELAQNLLGLAPGQEPACITQSGAPQGSRHMVFMDPEESPSTLAIQLLQAALARGLRTIVYCRSRRMTELVSLWAAEKADKFRGKISAYRAGFLPEERREIEAKMASGELLAVVSTSALELGIDIGTLDVCILVGYPGTIMSTLQRGGRVGRKQQASAVIMVAGEDALDQFFVHNPEEFFQRPPEKAVLNPDNEVVLARHLECAAAEMPLQLGERWLDGTGPQAAIKELESKGLLLRSADGKSWVAARKRPHRDVSLRGTGASFQLQDPEGSIIGSLDAHQAFREAHPGAVYLHRGSSYTIAELDLGAKIARAVPERVNWHTRVRTNKNTEILEVFNTAMAFAAPVGFGRLRVTETITGYERRLNGSMRLMDIQPLELPPQVFETEGFWFLIPQAAQMAVEDAFLHFMGSIHALEHVCIGLMPLLILADRNDLGGISTPMHGQIGTPAVFVYDGIPGGAGLSRGAFPQLCDLFQAVCRTLEACPCESGCPSCTHSPKCGSGNRPIDKAGALFLVRQLMEGRINENAAMAMPNLVPVESGTIADFISKNTSEPAMKLTPDGPIMIFDVETRRSAEDVGGWNKAHLMGVSVAVVWDGEMFHDFAEDELSQMFELLQRAGLVVGFNCIRFDYEVLQPFADFDLRSLPTLDMLDVIKKRLSYRVSLDNLGSATLDAPKTADGLQALRWWKEGKVAEIARYCRDDVDITRRLYEFGKENGYVLFTNKAGQKVRVPTGW